MPPQTFGLWIDTTDQAADARALRGDEPDLILRVAGHVSASDLINWGITNWPGRHVVREVTLRQAAAFLAVQAA